MTNTKNNSQGIRQGDIVRVKNVADHLEYARRWNIPTGTDLVVESVSNEGIVRFVGVTSNGFATRFTKVRRKPRVKGIVVKNEDVMAALTKFVKEDLGLDATVDSVIESFGDALMLVFAEDAA
ncbi:hypothetical protein ABIA22_001791 [Sinorhizobium fredii]|uniref:hypothetical protein n=1 Tax=Rhizobium fredii TaxID=380 RepID=UPI003511C874